MLYKITLIGFVFSMLLCDIYKVNANESSVFWVGRKITGEHNGTIDIKEGYINIENGEISEGIFHIDMNSISVVDMTQEYNKKLENHLKDSDFFDVQKFPLASFEIKGLYNFFMIDNVLFKGALTIKGTTIEKNIPVMISVNDSIAEAIGTIEVDRTLFGITYGSSSFFTGLADRAIDNHFTLKFKIVANKLINP